MCCSKKNYFSSHVSLEPEIHLCSWLKNDCELQLKFYYGKGIVVTSFFCDCRWNWKMLKIVFRSECINRPCSKKTHFFRKDCQSHVLYRFMLSSCFCCVMVSSLTTGYTSVHKLKSKDYSVFLDNWKWHVLEVIYVSNATPPTVSCSMSLSACHL
jgi:hypothetical protein